MNTVICGECLAVMPTLKQDGIDAIITDIPYGIGYEEWDVLHENTNSAYGGASSAQIEKGALYKRRGKPLNGWSDADRKIGKEYQEWCASWGQECLRVLKPGGSCLVFAGRRYAPRCVCALEDSGFTFKDMLAWEKKKAPHRAQRLSAIYARRGDDRGAAQWEGWRVANLRPLFEPILWFQKPYTLGGTLADNVLHYGVGAWNERALDTFNRTNIPERKYSNILYPEVFSDDYGLHPTQKPLHLMMLLVELVTTAGATVLDPFCGSGTTCLAAQKLKRKYIGIEKDADMANLALARLTQPAPTLFDAMPEPSLA